MALELLDDVTFKAIGLHILNPEIEAKPKWQVKVDVYNQRNKRSLKPAYMQGYEKTLEANDKALGVSPARAGSLKRAGLAAGPEGGRSPKLKKTFAAPAAAIP